MWIERLMAGISHQHVLSYNPRKKYRCVRMKLMRRCFFVKFYWKYNFMSLNENGRSLYIKKFYYKEKELICHGQKCYV